MVRQHKLLVELQCVAYVIMSILINFLKAYQVMALMSVKRWLRNMHKRNASHIAVRICQDFSVSVLTNRFLG